MRFATSQVYNGYDQEGGFAPLVIVSAAQELVEIAVPAQASDLR